MSLVLVHFNAVSVFVSEHAVNLLHNFVMQPSN